MAITVQTAATKRVPKDPTRKTALVAGIIYLITFVSIPTLALYGPVRKDYIIGPGADTRPRLLPRDHRRPRLHRHRRRAYPVVKRQNEGMALGFVAARVLEAACSSPVS